MEESLGDDLLTGLHIIFMGDLIRNSGSFHLTGHYVVIS